MSRDEEGSIDTLESDIEHVCQPTAPQVTQLWYKKLDNRSIVQDSRKVSLPQSSMRRSKPPERLSYMALMTKLINFEPFSFEEVAQHDVWQEAMVEEYDSIMKNQVWEVVPRSQGKKVVGSR